MSTAVIDIPSAEPRSSNLTVQPLTSLPLIADWTELFERDPDANPFQHPDYVLAEANFSTPDSRRQPVAVVSRNQTETEAIAILIPKTVSTASVGGLGINWKLNGYRLSGGSFLATSHNRPELYSNLLAAVVRHVEASGAQFLLIEDLDQNSQLATEIAQHSTNQFERFPAREMQKRWRIRFPQKADDYWQTFTARTRSKFRARLKKFGQSRLECITQVDQLPDFLKAAHEISAVSWQSRQFGLRIRNDQSELDRLSVLAQEGFLRSYLWVVEGEPAAFAIGHQRGGYFRYEEIAYVSKYSALSPGVTLLQQMIEDFYQHNPPTVLDFGGGDAEYKQKFGNDESQSQSLWLVPPRLRTRVTLAYLKACRGIRSITRKSIQASGLTTAARQWLRRGSSSGDAKSPAPDEANTNESGGPTT